MPFNGSGVYSALSNSFNPAVAGTEIDEADWAALLADLTAALSAVITKDGQTTATARVPFAAGISVSDGTVGTPGINFTSDTDNGLYRIGANNWGLSAGGTKVADLSAAGIVLSVAGNQTFANDAILAFASGTKLDTGHSGQASSIKTNGGSAIFTWGPAVEEIYFPGHTTTASGANAFLDSSSGQLKRSTSSLAFKAQIEDIAEPEKVLAIRGIWFRSKLKADNPEWSFYHFGAEDVAAIDPRFANWGRDVIGETEPDEAGARQPILGEMRPNGINHGAIIAHLVEVVKRQEARITALEAK